MLQSEKTKLKIIDTACQIISEQGYSATTTKEIAKQANISEATIFKYFKSKDNLLEEIVLSIIQQFYETSIKKPMINNLLQDTPSNWEETLKIIINERSNFFKENQNAFKLLFQELLVNQQVREKFKKQINTLIETAVNNLFKEAIKQGAIKNIDTKYYKIILMSLMITPNIFSDSLFNEEEENYDNNILIDILLNGIKEE